MHHYTAKFISDDQGQIALECCDDSFPVHEAFLRSSIWEVAKLARQMIREAQVVNLTNVVARYSRQLSDADRAAKLRIETAKRVYDKAVSKEEGFVENTREIYQPYIESLQGRIDNLECVS